MNGIEKNVAVVFEDAAEYEYAIGRERRLPNAKDFYVVLKDDSFGIPPNVDLAPDEIRNSILQKSPEPFSTWMRINGNDWQCVKCVKASDDRDNAAREIESVFDDVFRMSFTERLHHLHYVLEALGCKRTRIVSSESRSESSEDAFKQGAGIKVRHPTADVAVNEKSEKDDGSRYKTIIRQELCQEFSQHDKFDPGKVEPILRQYGFGNDPVLKGILDAEKLGRKGPAAHVRYSFSGEFVSDITSKIAAALKVSAKVSKVPVGGEFDGSLDKCCRQHQEIFQSFCIEIDNA